MVSDFIFLMAPVPWLSWDHLNHYLTVQKMDQTMFVMQQLETVAWTSRKGNKSLFTLQGLVNCDATSSELAMVNSYWKCSFCQSIKRHETLKLKTYYFYRQQFPTAAWQTSFGPSFEQLSSEWDGPKKAIEMEPSENVLISTNAIQVIEFLL